jgi:hypothetical protein
MIPRRYSLLSLFLCAKLCALAACGDDGAAQPDADLGDADAAPSPDAEVTPSATIVAVGGDYAGSGVLTTVSVPELEVEVNAVAGVVGGDPALRHFGDQLFIIDRFGGDSITILDRELSLVGQVSTGSGSNPQDVAVRGSTLYVAALDASGVLVIDLNDLDGGVAKTIDLSALDDVDGVPDCNSLHVAGNRLFVSCQILDRETFTNRDVGKIAVIDTADDTLETTLDLSADNPLALMTSIDGGDLVLSSAPGALFGGSNDTGCLERIKTSGTPEVLPCLAENSSLGAYPSAVLERGGELLFVAVKSFTEADVRSYGLGNESVSSAGLTPIGGNITDVALCPTGELVVADNSDGARGLRVFDDAGSSLTDTPLDVGWPQFFLPTNSTICW